MNFSVSDMSSEETTQSTGENLHEESKVSREVFVAFVFVAFLLGFLVTGICLFRIIFLHDLKICIYLQSLF